MLSSAEELYAVQCNCMQCSAVELYAVQCRNPAGVQLQEAGQCSCDAGDGSAVSAVQFIAMLYPAAIPLLYRVWGHKELGFCAHSALY